MAGLDHLLTNNRRWADRMRAEDPAFFEKLAEQQSPRYLWIGCSDSRVPANEIVGLLPGEIFVHRNVANVVVHTDLNCLSVIQFAVETLGVKHIIVCGHYGCGGVRASMESDNHGLIDNWLRHIQDVQQKHQALLSIAGDDRARFARLCELHVIEQVVNVCQTTVVRGAWRRGQPLTVHGWIYGLEDGLLRDLDLAVGGEAEQAAAYRKAIEARR
jgi:carbonic anhydrase